MALLNIVYTHSKDPEFPDSRRKTVKEMDEYLEGLVVELKFNGISVDYKSVEGDRNEVTVNGKTAQKIVEDLGDDIRIPEVDSDQASPMVGFARAPRDWNTDCIEDISDLLMKNVLSKSFAEADQLRIKALR